MDLDANMLWIFNVYDGGASVLGLRSCFCSCVSRVQCNRLNRERRERRERMFVEWSW